MIITSFRTCGNRIYTTADDARRAVEAGLACYGGDGAVIDLNDDSYEYLQRVANSAVEIANGRGDVLACEVKI